MRLVGVDYVQSSRGVLLGIARYNTAYRRGKRNCNLYIKIMILKHIIYYVDQFEVLLIHEFAKSASSFMGKFSKNINNLFRYHSL